MDSTIRSRRRYSAPPSDLLRKLEEKIIGQPQAMHAIVPYVQLYEAGLSPEGRPAGVFLLLGPTGTGKTRTVEVLAEVLHGSGKHLLKVDCGEFQLDHEVAKLIGAPPGYLGHRETHPMLSQAKLAAVTSARSDLSLVLIDEVEKAAPSLTRLLLGVLDKATLRLGDNTSVNFERSLIFLTSNLGARGMMKALQPAFGFPAESEDGEECPAKLEHIAMQAVRREFPPEFVNRVDVAITYRPLDRDALQAILSLQLQQLQQHIYDRLGVRGFRLEVPKKARLFLLREGTSVEYGAREMKRVVLRHVTQPLAAMVYEGMIDPQCIVRAEVNDREDGLRFRPML